LNSQLHTILKRLDIPFVDDPFVMELMLKSWYWRQNIEFGCKLYVLNMLPAAREVDLGMWAITKGFENFEGFTFFHEAKSMCEAETVLFGYVSVYHKYEAFKSGLTQLFSEHELNIQVPRRFVTEMIGIDFIKPDSGILYKYSWVANCTKHQDAIGSDRNNPPDQFVNYPPNKKIHILSEEFSMDCQILLLEFDNIIRSIYLSLIDFE